jgi:hypothetical protein
MMDVVTSGLDRLAASERDAARIRAGLGIEPVRFTIADGSPFRRFDVAWADRVLEQPLLQFPRARMARNGDALDPHRFTRAVTLFGGDIRGVEYQVDPCAVRRELRAGSTLILDRIESYDDELRLLTQAIGVEAQAEALTNVYVSDGSAAGFGLHADWCDNLVVQCEGRKRWEIYERAPDARADLSAAKPLTEIVLSPGDGLYLPRGFPHRVLPCGEPTFHAGIALVPTTLSDVVHWMLGRPATVESAFDARVPRTELARLRLSLTSGDATLASLELDEDEWRRLQRELRDRRQYGRL